MPNTVLHKYPSVKDYLYYGFILILLGLTAQSGDAAQGQSPTGEQQAPAGREPQPQTITVSSPSPSQTAAEQPQRPIEADEGTQNEGDDGSTFTDWIQVGINAALLVIIGFQTAIYWQQRSMMQRQIENATISERAYIGIKGIGMENFIIGQVPVVRITLENGGRTPAYKLKTPGIISLADTFPFERPYLGDVVGSTFLPAGRWTTCSVPFTQPLTHQWALALQTGERHAFIHVEVHFEDAWGQPQVTPFRLVYRPTDGRWGEYKDPEHTEPIIEITP